MLRLEPGDYVDDDCPESPIDRPIPELSVEEIKNFCQEHSHCAFCVKLDCTLNDEICKIEKCKYCRINLHSCKTYDHELICLKALSPCINVEYGCPEILRNELRGIHLAKCPASAVVCNLQWNREIIGKQAKRRMKQCARGFKKQMLDSVEIRRNDTDELDVFAALDDQHEIMKSYQTFRHSRVKQRTACTPANPVLPMRFYDKMDTIPEDDSSDEEKFKEEQERMKKKQPFADCYICKLEPGMQHLHILGNMNAKKADASSSEPEIPNLDKTLSIVVPKFYQKRNLFVKLSEARMSDFHRKAFQYYWTREMHTFTCTAVMRRDEIESHWKYHTDVLQLIDGGIIKRCPSSLNGCDFYVRQLIPKTGGRIRHDEVTRLFVYDSEIQIPPSQNPSKLEATDLGAFTNPHILRLLLPFLDTASVRTLSSLNSTFSYLVRGFIHSRTLTSIKWIKIQKNKWEFDGYERCFSNIPSVATLIPNVEANSAMAQHMAICSFCEKVDHSANMEALKFMGDSFKEYLKMSQFPPPLRGPPLPICDR